MPVILIHILETTHQVALASCLIYAWALIEYAIFILWFRSLSKMLPSVKLAEDKVLTYLILLEKNAKIVQL